MILFGGVSTLKTHFRAARMEQKTAAATIFDHVIKEFHGMLEGGLAM